MLYGLLIIIIFSFCNISFGSRYFAEIRANNTVKRVIVADSQEWCEKQLGGNWRETFMDNPDKNYAGNGHDYYEIYNDFVAPTPFVSWVLNEKRRWVAPVLMPKDGKRYKWSESIGNWEVAP